MIGKFDFNCGGYVSIEKDGVRHFYTHTPPSYLLFSIEKAFSVAQHNNLNDDALSFHHHAANRLEQLSVSAEEKPHIAILSRHFIIQNNDFSDLQGHSAVLQVRSAVLEDRSADLQVRFAVLKVRSAVLKVCSTVLKVCSAVLKDCFGRLNLRSKVEFGTIIRN